MFQRMADMSSEAFYLADYDGRFRYVNERALQLSGYSWDDFRRMTITDLDPDYPLELYRETIDAITPGQSPIVNTRARRKDGTFFPVDVSVARFTLAGEVYVFGVVRDVTARAQMEAAQKTFTQRMLQTLETERQRVARELDDNVGQALATVGVVLGTFERSASGALPAEARSVLDAARTLIQQITESVARIARDALPAELLTLGLEHTIRAHVRQFADRHRLGLRLTTGPVIGLLSRDQELHLYRVIQEALANVARHARATRVTVRLGRQRDAVVLVVRDDGVGLAKTSARETGLGLITMRERADLMGAKMLLRSAPRHGTELHVTIPIAPPSD